MTPPHRRHPERSGGGQAGGAQSKDPVEPLAIPIEPRRGTGASHAYRRHIATRRTAFADRRS